MGHPHIRVFDTLHIIIGWDSGTTLEPGQRTRCLLRQENARNSTDHTYRSILTYFARSKPAFFSNGALQFPGRQPGTQWATSRLRDNGSTWYLRCRHLHALSFCSKLVDVVSRSNTYRRTSCCSLRVLFVRVRVRWAIYAVQFRPSWRYDVDGRRCSRQYIDLMGGWLARHPPHPTASLAATFQTLRMMCFSLCSCPAHPTSPRSPLPFNFWVFSYIHLHQTL